MKPSRATASVAIFLTTLLTLAVYVVWDNWGDTWHRTENPAIEGANHPFDKTAQVERGRYLARAGNCVACHSAAGAAPMAGGRRIETPFGAVFSSNLTPDPSTGLGTWGKDDFWQALHHGRSKDGRLLYPAFPYTAFTRMPDEDLIPSLLAASDVL